MEDYFQIIFIAIFIISSIISSLNKKKKKQAKMAEAKSTNLTQETVSDVVQQKPANKMLEELLGFKVEIPEPPKRDAPVNYSENYDNTSWDPTKEYEDKISVKSQDGVSDFQAINDAKKDQVSRDRLKYQAFKEEKVVPRAIKKDTLAKKLFASQSNLKDYIIIQELLNKPKSLRR